jgi:DNA-binding MarR family transcriptional regulator
MAVETRRGYWYATSDDPVGPVEVLNMLRRYREAERKMRARTRASMGMGETDLLALRFLLRAKQRGEVVRQKELADALEITGASASTLVDRLIRDGYARRVAHPNDRRSVAVETTAHSDEEVRATLGAMHTRMLEAVENLSTEELTAVATFLTNLTKVVEDDLRRQDEEDVVSSVSVASADEIAPS